MKFLIPILLFANSASAELDISLVLESRTAMIRGAQYLRTTQTDGGWTQHAGVTAMAIWALERAGTLPQEQWHPAREQARAYILRHHQNGLFRHSPNDDTMIYSTAACLVALRLLGREADQELAESARRQLMHKQALLWAGATPASYGSANVFPYLTNAHWAMEAVRIQEPVERTPEQMKFWGRALEFLGRCQAMHLPKDNPNYGCFSYSGTFSDDKGDPWALGSFTAAGLKCMLYAGVEVDDARFTAALTWLDRNFSVNENPNAGEAGYYNYIYMLSTLMIFLETEGSLAAYPNLKNWRRSVAEALLNKQRGRGEWQNNNRMWREADPNLCTSYALIAMALALGE